MQGVGWFLRKAISLATVTLHIKEYTAPASRPASPSSSPSSDPSASPPNHTGTSTASAEPQTVTHIDIDQTATGGLKGTTENRTLDWKPREHADYVFGKLEGKARWIDLDGKEGEEITDEFLRKDWARGEGNGGGPDGCMLVQSLVRSLEKDWEADSVSAFYRYSQLEQSIFCRA